MTKNNETNYIETRSRKRMRESETETNEDKVNKRRIIPENISLEINDNFKNKNKVIKNKHVKSVLLGQDGSTIKTIAFNAINEDMGEYLLKKNNKLFNIAGKLSLNEWKGQSNVEFIIDDISVIKSFKK